MSKAANIALHRSIIAKARQLPVASDKRMARHQDPHRQNNQQLRHRQVELDIYKNSAILFL